METTTGPLRSPDGLWWWDGKAWQPIATLNAAPPPVDAAPAPKTAEVAPDTGAWQPPAGTEERPSDGWQPPSASPRPVEAAAETPAASAPPSAPAAVEPTREVGASGAWLPPGSTPPPVSAPARPTAAEAAPDDIWGPPAAAAQAPAATASATPAAQPDADWQPPPPIGRAAPPAQMAPAAAVPIPAAPGEPPRVVPPTTGPPPPAAAAAPPTPDVPWPNWLPRNERSEAVVDDVPRRSDPGAIRLPAAAPTPRTAPLEISGEARSSSWVSQLYPAGAELNANRKLVTYAGLGVLGLIALYVLFQVLSAAGLFSLRGGSTGTPPDTGPTGTQFQQADTFLAGSLNPALTSLATPVNRIPLDCGGTHSVTCRNTLDDADTAVVKAIVIIDKGPFPGCIAASTVQTRRDLVNLDQALKAALIGFRANSDGLVTKGIADSTALAPMLKTDGDALKAAAASGCPKTP